MEKFGFIIHPLDVSDITRKFEFAKRLSDRWVESMMKLLPALKVSEITGVRSRTGVEAEGWFLGCPLTSRQMVELPTDYVLKKIIDAGKKAQELGAPIVGLGAFTSVVGDAGITVAKNLDIAVTTGNSYTVATALQGIEYAAERLDVDMSGAQIAVLGASGSIGKASARILAENNERIILVARDTAKLQEVQDQIRSETQVKPEISRDIAEAVRRADVVVAVTSAVDAIVEPEDIKPGAIICDVARPRNISRSVAEVRDDVFVFEGGVVAPPGDVDFHFNFGFPPKTSYACMAETMILALEQRYENFSLGRDLEVARIKEIAELADKHGFTLAGLRSFERAVTEETFDKVRRYRKNPVNV